MVGPRALLLLMVLGAASPSRGDDLRDRAHVEFTAAQADFGAGRYESALDHLQKAYSLAPHPELLFNIARCFEELHRRSAAVDAYDRYLAVQPGDTAARDRVEALRKDLAANPEPPEPPKPIVTEPTPAIAPQPSPALVVERAPPPHRTPIYKRWWLWTAVGVVAVGVGVGLGVGLTRPSGPSTFPPLTAQ